MCFKSLFSKGSEFQKLHTCYIFLSPPPTTSYQITILWVMHYWLCRYTQCLWLTHLADWNKVSSTIIFVWFITPPQIDRKKCDIYDKIRKNFKNYQGYTHSVETLIALKLWTKERVHIQRRYVWPRQEQPTTAAKEGFWMPPKLEDLLSICLELAIVKQGPFH